MNKLLKLIRIDLLQSFSLNNLNRKHNNKNHKQIGSLILLAIVAILLFIVIMFYMFVIGFALHEINQLEKIINLGVSLGAIICFIYSFFKTSGLLYEVKDFELLMSLPIKTKNIVISKLVSLLLINYYMFGVIYIPSIITYLIVGSFSIVTLIISLIVFVTGPLLIISICGFVSFFVNMLLKRFKYKNSLMSTLYTIMFVGFFIVYMIFISNISDSSESELTEIGNMICGLVERLNKFYPISNIALEAIKGNFLFLLLFLTIMIIPFMLFVYFVSKTFLQCNMNAKSSNANSKYVLKNKKSSSVIGTLIKKEVKRFFSSSNIMLNLGLGPIMATILVVVNIVMNGNSMNGEGEIINVFGEFAPLLIVILSSIGFGMMPSTSSSINLEGKTLWILKSAPVKANNVLLAKSLFYCIICLPFAFINTCLYLFLNDFNIITFILIFVCQIIIIFIFSFEGLFINLLSPKLDWDNEVKAIKQTGAPVISMIFGFIIDALLFIIPFVMEISFGNGLIMVLILGIIILIIVSVLLFTIGKNKYEKLQA